ncbi:MAG: diguanylate cyclase, partial [Saccharofermentanales bacterium]
ANTEIDAAYHAAERIRKAVESHRFPEELRVTISGGVSQYSGEDISAFIHSADMNLYEAKRKGKNRIVM